MADLSFLIPSRNERYLAKTIENILANIRGDSEIIAVLDGAWADPPIPDHPRVQLIHMPTSIGQRAAINLSARVSTAEYVCKMDAHCAIDEGFDVKMMQAADECGHETTLIPAMFNLHAFNWRCDGCGVETYQGPTPTACATCASKGTSGGPFTRVEYWDLNANGVPGRPVRTEFWRFDHELHFAYWSSGRGTDKQRVLGYHHRPEAQSEIADVMSSVGACFFMRRSRFNEIGGLDEAHGSWGQFGTEIALKSWLSGGRHVVNKKTWFGHLFRTQGGDFGFPYVMRGSDQDRAREYSRNLWLKNAWPWQTRPLSWLIDKFAPVPGWHDAEGAKRLAEVKFAGATFEAALALRLTRPRKGDVAVREIPSALPTLHTDTTTTVRREGVPNSAEGLLGPTAPSKGLVFYSDCRGDARILSAVRQQILRAAPGLPLVSVTLQPLDFGRNIVLPLKPGSLTMFRQILAGLEALDTDVAFLVEHDVLYSPDQFQFKPPTRDRFYYNEHRWQVSAETGQAAHYRCCQTAQLCADRLLLIAHYRKRIAAVEAAGGYQREMGFEPGTNKWARGLDSVGHETWRSGVPNIDIRHGRNLSKTRWSQAEFRNKSTCQGWTDGDGVPGWGQTRGRFNEFLADVGRSALATEGAA